MLTHIQKEFVLVSVVLCFNSLIAIQVAAERIEARSLKKVAAQPGAAPESEEVRSALEAFNEGRVEDALQTLQPFTKDNPDVAPAEIFIAQWFGQAKQPTQARRWLERATRAAPADPEPYIALGNVNINEQRWTEATLLFDKAIELRTSVAGSKRELSTLLRILAGRAAIAQATEDWQAAERYLQELVARQPEPNESVWHMFGRVLFRQDRPAEAIEKLQRAAQINEDMLAPEAILAGWYQQSDDLENMKKWLEIALEKDGDDVQTRLAAAGSLLRSEQFDAAIDQAEAALELEPDSFEANLLLGNITLLLEEHQTAVPFLEKAAMQSPGSFPATNSLALALCEGDLDQQKRALEYAEMNVQRFPNQPGAVGTLGWVLYKSGRTDDAETVLQRAINGGAKSPELGYYFAQLLVDRGKKDEATRVLQSALQGSNLFFGRSSAEMLLKRLAEK